MRLLQASAAPPVYESVTCRKRFCKLRSVRSVKAFVLRELNVASLFAMELPAVRVRVRKDCARYHNTYLLARGV